MSVLPAAIGAWVAVDMLGPLPLNAGLFAGSLVGLSPVVMDFLVQGGEHLLVFASYGGAVLAAWKAAPTGEMWVASSIGVLFLVLRFAMTYSALMPGDFTTDSPTRFLVGTIAAVGGVAVALAGVVGRMRYVFSTGLVIVGGLVWSAAALFGLFWSVSFVAGSLGPMAALLALFIFPATLVAIPVIIGFAVGEWGPAIVVYGGAVAGIVVMGISSAISDEGI